MQTRLCIFIFLLSYSLQAQQLPLFTQYREYHSIINPATINSDYMTYEHNVSAGVSWRNQWTDLGSIGPKTGVARFESVHSDYNMLGGMYLIHDKVGPSFLTSLMARYAYVLSDDPRERGLSIGFNAGVVRSGIATEEISFTTNNPNIPNGNLFSWHPDFGVGMFYYQSFGRRGFDGDKFYAGISVPQTFNLKSTYKYVNSGVGPTFINQRVPHYFALIGMYKYLNESSFLEPSAWIRYVVGNKNPSIDANLRYQMQQSFWIGCGYSTTGQIHAEAGFLLGENIDWDGQNVKLGFGFDAPLNSTYGPSFGNSFEFNLSWTLDTGGRRR